MKFLILGHKGFIGSAIKSALEAKAGVEIVSGIDYDEFDVLSDSAVTRLSNLIRPYEFDIVINCIGRNGAGDALRNPDLFYRINGVSALTFMELSYKLRWNRFIHISSETVYGFGEDIPEDAPLRPAHPYAFSKAIFDILMLNSWGGLPGVHSILRLPIVVGPNSPTKSAYDFIREDVQGGGLVRILGNGAHRRKFIQVVDVAKLVWLVALSDHVQGVKVFNSPGHVFSMLNLAEHLARGRKLPLEFAFSAPSEPSQTSTIVSKTSDIFANMELSDI